MRWAFYMLLIHKPSPHHSNGIIITLIIIATGEDKLICMCFFDTK